MDDGRVALSQPRRETEPTPTRRHRQPNRGQRKRSGADVYASAASMSLQIKVATSESCNDTAHFASPSDVQQGASTTRSEAFYGCPFRSALAAASVAIASGVAISAWRCRATFTPGIHTASQASAAAHPPTTSLGA